MKTFDRFTTKDSYSWNITHNTESTAVGSLVGITSGSREIPGRKVLWQETIIIILIIIINIMNYYFIIIII